MTRKHFAAIAAALKASKPTDDGTPCYPRAMKQWRASVSEVRRACAGFNGQFDGNRFLDACGFDD